jgi:hypothetical protein
MMTLLTGISLESNVYIGMDQYIPMSFIRAHFEVIEGVPRRGQRFQESLSSNDQETQEPGLKHVSTSGP